MPRDRYLELNNDYRRCLLGMSCTFPKISSLQLQFTRARAQRSLSVASITRISGISYFYFDIILQYAHVIIFESYKLPLHAHSSRQISSERCGMKNCICLGDLARDSSAIRARPSNFSRLVRSPFPIFTLTNQLIGVGVSWTRGYATILSHTCSHINDPSRATWFASRRA